MAFIIRGHGSNAEKTNTTERRINDQQIEEAAPADGDITVAERADFGYLHSKFDQSEDYLPVDLQTIADLDELGNKMIDNGALNNAVDATSDSALPPVLTYWGQFLDHELTAGTDRDSPLTGITDTPEDDKPAVHPPTDPEAVELGLKNIRNPRFDLDSVYGGDPLGEDMSSELSIAVATVIAGMRKQDPSESAKMRIGTVTEAESIPDELDAQRDLPRFDDVSTEIRDAMHFIAPSLVGKLNGKALIGDMRNDENLIVAQFHLSFLRFHNSVVDFLKANNTGWISDYHSAKKLTRLHYQWLIIEGYLKQVCDPAVVDRIIANGASHFFDFQDSYRARHTAVDAQGMPVSSVLGNVLPLEFSVAAFRFGHTMVRNSYDYNAAFGRPANEATFDLLFAFTGEGGFFDKGRVPGDWVIDWSRFVGSDPHDASDGKPARNARSIDTDLAPPLKDMKNTIKDKEGASESVKELFKHLARRNLRRGYNLKISTGQALHQNLKEQGALLSDPIEDVSGLFDHKPELQQFLARSQSKFHQKTPLWFYLLAEAEASGGEALGELGSWIVASTFLGVLFNDPDSALSRQFEPQQSPLKMSDGSPIDSIEKWMKFAGVML